MSRLLMRIISKFKDFYDVAQGQGQDSAMMFVRHRSGYPAARDDKTLSRGQAAFVAFCWANSPRTFSLSNYDNYLSIDVDFGFVLFAGRLYPYAAVNRLTRFGPVGTALVVCFDLAHLTAELPNGYLTTRRFTRGFGAGRSFQPLGAFFATSGSEALLVSALNNSLAVLSWTRSEDMLTVNPMLASLQFYRRLDAWQAFQELSMFLGNIAAPDCSPLRIEDKDRIAQYGFDKWSFRKMPGKHRALP